MTVTSPIKSFVDFESRLEGTVLPLVDFTGFAFQLMLERGTVPYSDVLKLQIVTPDEGTMLLAVPDAAVRITEGGSWTTISNIPTDETLFPVTVTTNPIIPSGIYLTYEDLAAAFTNVGMTAGPDPFIYACQHAGISYSIPATTTASADATMTVTFERGMQYIYFLATSPDPFAAITAGTCFRFCLYNQTQNEKVYSNVFQRKSASNYLMQVQYSNNEDAFDFHYGDATPNMVYLPLLLQNPQYNETRKVYRKSNGTYKLLSSTIEKKWDLSTDYLPDVIHDRINVMLAHDNVFLSAYNLSSNVIRSADSDYNVAWPDNFIWGNTTPVATAKTNLTVAFVGRNSNCEFRAGCVLDLGCQGIVISSVTLPNAMVNTAYNQTIGVSGTQDITLSNFNAPDGLTYNFNGVTVTISGTPTTEGDNQTISFTLTNCNGDVTFSQTINVLSDCVPVAITPVTLPNAVVGVAFEQFVFFTGTNPVGVQNITLPSWMNWQFFSTAQKLRFYGTPNAVETGETIYFELTNCGSPIPVVFDQDIDVGAGDPTFVNATNVGGDSTHNEDTVQIQATPNTTVVLHCKTYSNTNSNGTLKVNGSICILDDTFNIPIGSSGLSDVIDFYITGTATNGTVVEGVFEIQYNGNNYGSYTTEKIF